MSFPDRSTTFPTRSSAVTPQHHFTVDVEEYFHPHAMEPYVSRDEWDALDRRSPALVERLLDGMDAHEARGTFFVLGWLAEREPEMVREISRRGHEIASHGWDHRRVTGQEPEEFRTSIRRSKRYLEDLVGREVLGFRAPSFSIVPGVEWAFDVLLEEGYAYDSSLFPVSTHPSYGYPAESRDPHWIDRSSGRILEFPMSTFRLLGRDLPASGGAYFRFFPLALIRGAFRQAGRREAPGMFYVHPWETDPELPLLGATGLTRLRMKGGTRRAWDRLTDLWSTFDFRPVAETVRGMKG